MDVTKQKPAVANITIAPLLPILFGAPGLVILAGLLTTMFFVSTVSIVKVIASRAAGEAKQSISKLDPTSRLMLQDSNAPSGIFASLIEKSPKQGRAIFVEGEALKDETTFETFMAAAPKALERMKDAPGGLSITVVGEVTRAQAARLEKAGMPVIAEARYKDELHSLSKAGKEIAVIHLNNTSSEGFFKEMIPDASGKPIAPEGVSYIAIEKGTKGIISGFRLIFAALVVRLLNDKEFLALLFKEGISKGDLDNLLHPQTDGSYLSNAAPLLPENELNNYNNALLIIKQT